MKTLSVLRDDFPTGAAGAELVDAVRRLRLGELMVLLSGEHHETVNELSSPETLTLAAVDAFNAVGLETVRMRARAAWLRSEDFADPGEYLPALMLAFGGPEEFFRLMSMARRIHLAAGLLPL